MRKVCIKEVTKVISGFAFNSNAFSESGELPLARIRDVQRGFSETYYTGEYDPKYLLQNGDLLIGMDGEFNVEKWQGGKALLNQRVCKIESDGTNLDQVYLYYFLPKELKKIEYKTPSVTVKHLSIKNINDIQIPLPLLPEQKRIAAILDKADAVRRKRKEALRLMEEFLRSAFMDIVGTGASDYEKWPEDTIESLALNKKDSIRTVPFGSDLRHSEFVDEGIAVLGIDNAVKNYFEWGERRFITPEKYEKLKRYKIFPGDVIITIMGTTGRSAVIPDDIPLAITTKHLAAITLNRELAHPEFIAYAIHDHPEILHQIEKAQRGAIMYGLNLTLIKELRLRVPPMAVQERFTSIARKARKTRDKLTKENKVEVSNLFKSLVQRAFRGELKPKEAELS